MTARWVVDVVQPERDLTVTWEPISLLFKNEPAPESEYYERSKYTHDLLRVFESVKTDGGNDAAFAFYWEAATRIHHDEKLDTTPAEILEAVGLDTKHAAANDDGTTWDPIIRTKMHVGLDLVGHEVGTPIIAFDTPDGKTGIFGPVITRAPQGEEGLALWDAMVTMATMDGFWELKRTRTERPDFGQRP